MASYFADGSTVHLATAIAAAKNITAVSNAATAVATSTAHGLANGDVIVLASGWGELDERVFKVAGVTADTFQLAGVNSSDVKRFPAGAGVGAFRKITAFTQIRQVTELSTQGGEQQYGTFSYLEEKGERQIPTTRSARSIQFGIGDDPTLAGYKAAKTASDSGVLTPLRIDLPNGGQIFFNGYPSLNEMPTLEKGQLVKVQFDYSVAGEPNRY